MNQAGKTDKIKHLNLVLRTIRNVNRLILREKDRTQLLKGICEIFIKNRGYYNAWIALLDECGKLETTAEAGLGEQFLPLMERLRNGKLTDCARKALSQSAPVAMKDPVSECSDCPLSASYGGRGAMTTRLEHNGKVYGIASVSTPKNLATEKEEMRLFAEVTGDIAFALHSLELGEKYKQAVENLKTSADKYRILFETTGTATVIIEEDTTISVANTEFEKLSGYSKEEIEGKKSWADFVAEKDTLERMKEYHTLRRVNPDAAPKNYEFKFMDKKGVVKDILATWAMIPRTKKSIGSFLDITELKRAEKALRESEQRLRYLVENSLTGIFVIQDNQIVLANPEQERLSGPLPDTFIPMDLEYVHPDDVDKVRHNYEAIRSGQVQTMDTDFRFYPPGKMDSKPDMKWVYCRASQVKHHGKDAVLVNMMDLTKTKEMESLLKIQDKMSALGHVAAGIAHEIRNPLSGINIYLTTLEKVYDRGGSGDTIKQIIRECQSASRKIESIIKRVMDFAKPSAPQFVMADINQPIEEAMRLSSVMLRKTGIEVEKSLAQDLPPSKIAPQLIEEVILNLITNAAEAMKNIDGAKKMSVASCKVDDHIVVQVSDSGPGVPLKISERIFDPFYTTKNESTGIGLSLCHRIISDHSGTLGVSTSKWGGAEFTIRIPIGKQV